MNTTANRTWLLPEIPVVQRGRVGGSWRWATGSIHQGPRPGTSLEVALEGSCPWRPPQPLAGTGLFPTAHSQGAARPQSYSSPRLCPGLGLAATPNTLRVFPQSGSKLGPREDPPLDLWPPEQVACHPLPSWSPQSTSPTSSHLPACHSSLFPAPATLRPP